MSRSPEQTQVKTYKYIIHTEDMDEFCFSKREFCQHLYSEAELDVFHQFILFRKYTACSLIPLF